MRIERKNIITGKTSEMDLPVTNEQLNRWVKGELIQNVMPHLTDTQREFLITGMTEEDQLAFFGKRFLVEGEECTLQDIIDANETLEDGDELLEMIEAMEVGETIGEGLNMALIKRIS